MATIPQLLAELEDAEDATELVHCPEVTAIPGWAPSITLQLRDDSNPTPEDEDVVYKQHAKLFRYRDAEWVERGIGRIMLLTNHRTRATRFLMWQDRTYKTIANASIVSAKPTCDLQANAEDPSTWEWDCVDHSSGNAEMQRFALHFETQEQAAAFKQAFDEAKARFQTFARQPQVPFLLDAEVALEIEQAMLVAAAMPVAESTLV